MYAAARLPGLRRLQRLPVGTAALRRTMASSSQREGAATAAVAATAAEVARLHVDGPPPQATAAAPRAPLIPVPEDPAARQAAAAALHAQALLMARYHVWAYETLLALLDKHVPDDEYFAHAGLVFRSIHGTLTHLLLADALWFRRVFPDRAVPEMPEPTEAIGRLWSAADKYATAASTEVPWETFERSRAALAARLRAQSAAWVDALAALPPARLLEPLRYRNTSGREFEAELVPTLSHVFNHGTWHRCVAATTPYAGRCGDRLTRAAHAGVTWRRSALPPAAGKCRPP